MSTGRMDKTGGLSFIIFLLSLWVSYIAMDCASIWQIDFTLFFVFN